MGRARADATNRYLNADALRALFLEPLEPYRSRIACLIFEFGARGATAREFVGTKSFRFSIDCRRRSAMRSRFAIANISSTALFRCLREHQAAHVFNAWTKMPPLAEQIAMPDAFTADFTVVRALLARGPRV